MADRIFFDDIMKLRKHLTSSTVKLYTISSLDASVSVNYENIFATQLSTFPMVEG